MIQVLYNGVDVTNDISVNRCYHDMYAEGRSDTLYIRFNDISNIWDRWKPKNGDEINVVYGSIRTGTMFVYSILPKNGLYAIKAMSAPMSAFVNRNKAWRKVTLLQIATEIAIRHGLTLVNQGVSDYLYDYILQNNESDFAFLHKRCILEGCAFLVFDKKLVIYSQASMEQQSAGEKVVLGLDGNYLYNDKSDMLYGKCRIECGKYAGEFIADSENENVYIPQIDTFIGNKSEAMRFSKGMLREANKGAYTGYLKGNIQPQYAAASVLNVENDRAPSWNGNVYATHIRNNYATGRTKIFFRKPLEGY